MTGPRIQVGQGVPTAAPQPVSFRPADTYQTPNVNGSQAAQLAQALAGLAPDLAELGNAIFARNKQKEAVDEQTQGLAGAEAARKVVQQLDASRTSYADAVAAGQIPALDNPWMRQGYYEELGRTYAGRFNADATVALSQDDQLKDSIEPKDFRQKLADFEGGWKDSNVPKDIRNPAFNVGFGTRRDAIVANLESNWSAGANQKFQQRTVQMFSDQSTQYVEDALSKGQSMEQIGTFLRQSLDDKHAIGWNSQTMGNALIDSLAQIAIEHKDTSLFTNILKSIPSGPGEPSRAYAVKVGNELTGKVWEAQQQDFAKQKQDREKESTSIWQDAGSMFQQATSTGAAPGTVNVTPLLARAISNGDHDLYDRIQTMQKAYKNAEYTDDGGLVAGLQLQLHRGPYVLKQNSLDNALKNKHMSIDTYNQMSNELSEAQRAARTESRETTPGFLEKDGDFKYGNKATSDYFGSSPDSDTPEVAWRRGQALVSFERWYNQNFVGPDATNAKLQGQAKRELMDKESADLARVWIKYTPTPGAGGSTFRMNGAKPDWQGVEIGDAQTIRRITAQAQAVVNKTAQPTPELSSYMNVYGLKPEDLPAFIAAQQKFIRSRGDTTTVKLH